MINITNKNRKRRLRKKLRINEFAEHGFSFSVAFKDIIDVNAEIAFINSFIEELLDPMHLQFAGCINGGAICHKGRGTVTEDDKEAVNQWLLRQEIVKEVNISPLIDAWYGDFS